MSSYFLDRAYEIGWPVLSLSTDLSTDRIGQCTSFSLTSAGGGSWTDIYKQFLSILLPITGIWTRSLGWQSSSLTTSLSRMQFADKNWIEIKRLSTSARHPYSQNPLHRMYKLFQTPIEKSWAFNWVLIRLNGLSDDGWKPTGITKCYSFSFMATQAAKSANLLHTLCSEVYQPPPQTTQHSGDVS